MLSSLVSLTFSDSTSPGSLLITMFLSDLRCNFLCWSLSGMAGLGALLVPSCLLARSSGGNFGLLWTVSLNGASCALERSPRGGSFWLVALKPLSWSKKSTCTTVLNGRRSFFTAWAHTSGDSFWQSRIRQRRFFSALFRSGCS